MRIYTKEEITKELFDISTKIVVLVEQNIREKRTKAIDDLIPTLSYVLEAVKYLKGKGTNFLNVSSLPLEYVLKLREEGNRNKSRCFIEYVYDIDSGEDNSVSFYSVSWNIAISIAHEWIKEFDDEIIKFDTR